MTGMTSAHSRIEKSSPGPSGPGELFSLRAARREPGRRPGPGRGGPGKRGRGRRSPPRRVGRRPYSLNPAARPGLDRRAGKARAIRPGSEPAGGSTPPTADGRRGAAPGRMSSCSSSGLPARVGARWRVASTAARVRASSWARQRRKGSPNCRSRQGPR